MKKVAIVVIAVLVLAGVGGGAFYYGTKVGENRVLQNPQLILQRMAGQQGERFQGQFQGEFPGPSGTPQAGQRGIQGPGGGLMGTIEQVEGNTVVISTDEGSVRVQTSDTTLIEKTMSVNVGDLELGERVIVSGSKNDDGSYTARSIQSVRGMQLGEANQP